MGHVGNTDSRKKKNSYIKGSKQKILLYGSKFERSWPRSTELGCPRFHVSVQKQVHGLHGSQTKSVIHGGI